MTNQVTQEQMDAYNDKWKKKQADLYNVPVIDPEKAKEYKAKMDSEPKIYEPEEAREIFRLAIASAALKTVKEINQSMIDEPEYRSACGILRDYCFGFENKALNEIGGIYICGEPGTGKTCLLIAACNTLNNLSLLKTNGWKRHTWFNMTNDISKKIKGENPDLTYNIDCSIILDDMTERINQVNHFDYKFSLNEIIQNRYNQWKSRKYMTIISSNIHPAQFNKLLDERSISRFKEQYLLIELLGKNKRI